MKPENWCEDNKTLWQNTNYRRNCQIGAEMTDKNGGWCMYEQSNNISPYDHLSIMHYPGSVESNTCGPLFTYKVKKRIEL